MKLFGKIMKKYLLMRENYFDRAYDKNSIEKFLSEILFIFRNTIRT
jgi:hypothetical protein